MKLKKNQTDSYTVLSVSESVALKDVQILKAGLIPLLASADRPVILDLNDAEVQHPEGAKELASLPQALLQGGAPAPLIVRKSSKTPKIPELLCEETLGEAESKAASALGRLAFFEPTLQSRIRRLETEKNAAEARSKAAGGAAGELRAARAENARLKRLIQRLERALGRVAKTRTAPLSANSLLDRQEEIEKAIHGILKSQGLLPSGGKP